VFEGLHATLLQARLTLGFVEGSGKNASTAISA
jgi:hypothetical protein